MTHMYSQKYIVLALMFLTLVLSSCSQMPSRPTAVPSADQDPLPTTKPSSATNNIVKYSHQKLGIPYLYGGSTPKAFDCSGLTRYVYNEAGIPIPRTAKQQQDASLTIPYQNLQPGDLAFYKTGRNTHHVGIYIGNNQMIHASTGSRRVRKTNITMDYWRKRFIKFGRFIR